MFTQHRCTIIRGLGPRSARLLVAAALCVALVAATPAAANAASVDDADSVGDMVRNGRTPDPERTLNDISHTKLTHGARRVAIKVDYADLKRKAGGRSQYLGIHMVTNEGAHRHIELEARPRHWSGTLDMYKERWRHMGCAVRHSIDYQANVLKVRFPRICASNPRWVRFRIGVEVWNHADNATIWVDDGLRDRPTGSALGSRLKRSQRVHVHGDQRAERGVADADAQLAPPPAGCRRTGSG